ncbi:uncharacterized protein LY79DRAFT_570500 [Colletotrichum navitas]|uniref:Uncharacterized protein n=1 Tax=Colletotrichum navitas TaxID=681940 RepID=A0AAD8PML1_9PEZI|nr:uncharacterized protein LY79DRAFT_570500 [Colletotrichum navitas]KAK1570085.1 hypothetical protein LY79DRAFT_570500 [Colletotrichum navitas]
MSANGQHNSTQHPSHRLVTQHRRQARVSVPGGVVVSAMAETHVRGGSNYLRDTLSLDFPRQLAQWWAAGSASVIFISSKTDIVLVAEAACGTWALEFPQRLTSLEMDKTFSNVIIFLFRLNRCFLPAGELASRSESRRGQKISLQTSGKVAKFSSCLWTLAMATNLHLGMHNSYVIRDFWHPPRFAGCPPAGHEDDGYSGTLGSTVSCKLLALSCWDDGKS